MLQDVADLNLSDCYGKVGVPKQLVITQDPSSIPEAVSKAGMILPLVAKPLIVDGTAKSHELSIAYDQFSLSLLEPPWFFKNLSTTAIKVLRRFSLPDVTEKELLKNSGVFRFPRVSCAAASAEYADVDPTIFTDFLLSFGQNKYKRRHSTNN
ncbi:unnamed protein product [Spirodela intermedia]|uniref:inositol-1,3,4-trisphosphate 5/6-kinase n=1 Tax=Spirodela intermedia TaxID=51605 RepID=A0A7I8IYY9_SPIIN|nr:unnamed protein product [Spirodela intermedia]CAA6663009.1 unnamed protein product [Spirodela intermedia]